MFTAPTEMFYNRQLGRDFVSPEGVPYARHVIFSSISIWKLLLAEPAFSSVVRLVNSRSITRGFAAKSIHVHYCFAVCFSCHCIVFRSK